MTAFLSPYFDASHFLRPLLFFSFALVGQALHRHVISQPPGLKLLLIGDNPREIRLIRKLLGKMKEVPFALECADGLSTGLQRLAQGGIDLVLLGRAVLDRQGAETFIKVQATAPEAPIVVLAGLDDAKPAGKVSRQGSQESPSDEQATQREIVSRVLRHAAERRQTEEMLREERDTLEMVTEGMGAGLAVISKDYRTLWANRVLKQLCGDDIEGKTCYLTYNQRPEVCPNCGVREVFETGKSLVVHEQVGKDAAGNTIWSQIAASPIMDKDRNITSVLELVVPITERKKAEDELRQSEARYRQLADSLPEIVFETDEEGTLTYANHKALQTFGYTAQDLETGFHILQAVHPEDREKAQDLFRRRMLGEELGVIEFIAKRKDGTGFPAALHTGLVVRDGKPVGMRGIVTDMTERRRAEEALRESEERFRKMFEEGPIGMGITDADYRFIRVNQAFCRMLGYDEQELIGRSPLDITDPEDRETDAENASGLRAGDVSSYHSEKRYIAKDKRTVWANLTASLLRNPEGKPQYFLGIVENITERRRAEESLRRSERTNRSLVDNLPQKIFLKDTNSVYVGCNSNYGQDLGIGAEEIVGKTDYDFYPRELAEKYRRDDRRIMDLGHAEEIDEAYIERGQERLVHTVKTPVRDDGGNTIGILGIFWDITEHTRAEQALQESEERFRNIFEEGPVGMGITDMDSRIVRVNQAYCQMLGYDEQELIGRSPLEITYPEDLETTEKHAQRLLAGEVSSYQIEKRYLTKDKRAVWVNLTSSILRDQRGEPQYVLGILENITDRKQAEEKVHCYEQKLRAIALELTLTQEQERRRLAVELHDHLSQDLVVSHMKLQALQQLASSTGLAEPLDDISQRIERLIQLTSEFTFQLSPPVLYELGFEAAVEWLAERFQEQHGIAVTVERTGEHPPLDTEMSILLFRVTQELLMNVVKHASAHHATVLIGGTKEDIRIEVADDGVGVDCSQPACSQIGGFGLFSVQERLRYFNGQFEIESAPGRGTRVSLVVPAQGRPRRRKRHEHTSSSGRRSPNGS